MAFRAKKNCLVVLTMSFLLGGCSASFDERHFFKLKADDSEKSSAHNYYRLQIKGRTMFSSARYLSGYYDERALDLFFNEIKAPSGSSNVAKLFEDDAKAPGSDARLQPLSPDAGNGKLVMILSTNANAVAGAIGEFAQGQAVAAALTNLVNRDAVRAARREAATQGVASARAKATLDELTQLFAVAKTTDVNDEAAIKTAYLRLLSMIAGALQPATSPRFNEFAEAEVWFDTFGGGR